MIEFNHFIDLDRRFLDVTEMKDSEEAALHSYTATLLGKEPGLGWKDVLASRIVVILGEPGSGKTWELRNRANPLKKLGFSFFIHLDRLVESPIEEVLNPADQEQFIKWRKRGGEVTFFLDSVDEAKFRKQQDFARALDCFARGVGRTVVRRVRLVISSRISEWRVHADREELLQRFGNIQVPREKKEKKNTTESPEFRVVQLEPLDRSRVKKFAEEVGLQNPESFIDAVDIHHAWEFVRRPIDVADLIGYWREHGQLGTLSELIEFSLSNKLRESSERIQNDPLTPQLARIGVECLSAAVLLCRRFNFFVPDAIPPTDTSGALIAEQCLPNDWSPAESRAMLNRPIFDAASYGRIRFHHRRIAEFLAASWLGQRMKEGCPYPALEDMLFALRDSYMIIRPSLRPVVAWLAIGNEAWNRRIREQVLACAPDLFLTHGDPESLPIEFKKSLLDHLIAHFSGRELMYVDTDAEALGRMAAPELAPQIASMLRETTTSPDMRILLLRIIRHGQLRDCLDDALDIAESPHESDELKSYAVAAIRDVGDKNARCRLAEIVQSFENIETRFCGLICEAIYPQATGPQGLAGLLSKAQRVEQYSVDLPWYLKEHLKDNLPGDQAAPMLQELIRLAQEMPRIRRNGKDTPISAQFYWLGEVIPVVLVHLLNRARLENHEVELAARALWLLKHFKHYGKMDRDLPGEFNSLLDRYPAIRRAYVWICIEGIRNKKPEREPSLFSVFDSFDIVEQREADIDWLIQDIRENPSQENRITALNLAVHLWWHLLGRKRSVQTRIKRSTKGNRELVCLFKKESAYSLRSRVRGFLYRHGFHDWQHTAWRLRHWISGLYSNLREKIWLWRNLKKLRDGTAIRALYGLAFEAFEEDYHRGARSWEPLKSKRGTLVARAAADGWKAVWCQFEPPLPHEKQDPKRIDNRVIIGLSGINIAIDDGDLNLAAMTSDDARRASRYAVNELNGFADWLPELAKYHADSVRAVLAECVLGEWRIPADREHVYEVLSSLGYDAKGMGFLVADDILKELQSHDPLHYDVLKSALVILLNLSDPPRVALADLASQRTAAYAIDDPRFILWMAVWIQLDSASAMKKLKDELNQAQDHTGLMVKICAGLSTHFHRGYPLIENPDYLNAELLREFIPLVFHYVSVEEDIDRTRGSGYTPTARDHAQDFRNSLIERLSRLPDPQADDLLHDFSEDPIFIHYRDYILHLIDQRVELSSEAIPWQPEDIQEFMQEHETSPHSAYELFKIACKRFSSIKDEVESGDISSRYDLHYDDQEPRLRSWLARQLRPLSKKHYTVSQEEEIDLEQRPDLRIEAPDMGPVSIEVKWANNWSLNQLREGLIDQLIGKYLRASDSNYGIYVLGYKGNKRQYWKDRSGRRVYFNELAQYLQDIAEAEVKHRNYNIGLKVFSINFQRPPGE